MIGNTNDRNRGIGTFAVSEMLKHGFGDMNLNRIELEVLASNSRAIHLYHKLGFSEEGLKRQAAYKEGSYVDVICMALLREEWMQQGIS